MAELWWDFRQYYWAHREAFRIGAAVFGSICVLSLILLWTMRVVSELSALRERMSRLADGLALLTDTTEAGMSTLHAQIAQANREIQPVKRATRASVQKRVKEAVRKGERISKIAAHESLSESEVGLHLALSERDRFRPQTAAPAGDAVPDGSLIA